jgi:hypothetical protein
MFVTLRFEIVDVFAISLLKVTVELEYIVPVLKLELPKVPSVAIAFTYKLEVVILSVFKLVVVMFVFRRFVLTIFGTVVFVIVVFVRLVNPVTDKLPVLKLTELTVVWKVIPDTLSVDVVIFCRVKFVVVMLLVLILVDTTFEVVRLVLIRLVFVILVFVRFVDVILVKLEFVPLIVVVVILLVVILVVFISIDCILLDVKFVFHKFWVVTLLSMVFVFTIKFSLVIDVIVPFVDDIKLEYTFDVVMFDNTLRIDNTADDPEISVTTKFVVVVLIACVCVVIKDDVVIFVIERFTAFILFVIRSVEADIFVVSIFVEIKLDVVKFVVIILDVIILDDVILVFNRLVIVEFV